MTRAVSSVTSASRCGAVTGSARSRRLFTSEKIAVFAPMPSARDRTTTAETIGVERRDRRARRMSFMGIQISEFRIQNSDCIVSNLKSELLPLKSHYDYVRVEDRLDPCRQPRDGSLRADPSAARADRFRSGP